MQKRKLCTTETLLRISYTDNQQQMKFTVKLILIFDIDKFEIDIIACNGGHKTYITQTST